MSGILTPEMVEKLRSTLENGLGGYEDFITGENARAALEAVLPLIGETIAKLMASRTGLEVDYPDNRVGMADYVRRLTASEEP